MKEPRPKVDGNQGIERLKDFTRRILAVPKEEIADKLREPVRPRRKRRGTRAP